MTDKKIKIIILAIIVLLATLGLIFALKVKSKNIANKVQENKNNTEAEIAVTGVLKELKNNHPEYNQEQIKFYNETAAKGNMVACIGRDDESDCVSSVAFIKDDYKFCGEVKDEKAKITCTNAILPKNAASEIEKCRVVDLKESREQCLINIFQIYFESENCSGLKENESKIVCESVVYYQKAIREGNKKICGEIRDELLKISCFKNVYDEERDTDNDGLTDKDEFEKYKTDSLMPDTDNDGFKDGDEVKAGYNPRGKGKL